MNDGNQKSDTACVRSVSSNERIEMVIHDLRNSLSSIILNLEIVSSPEYSSGIALEAAMDALTEARRLNKELPGLRAKLGVNR